MDTGVVTDPRSNSHADALWDGMHLYLASHLSVADREAAVAGYPSHLYRYSYDPATGEYSLDAGFPVTINDYRTETLVGDWTSHTVARVEECPSRATGLLDETSRAVHMFMTFPAPPDYVCSSSGGAIHEKTAPLDAIAFSDGLGGQP